MGLIGVVWVMAKYILPRIMAYVAKSSEFLLLFGLAWCFMLGSLFDYAGFSMEIGTLLAGISFAMSPYRVEIQYKLTTLRDFFLVMFFLLTGMELVIGDLGGSWGMIFLLSLIVLVLKPLIIAFLTKKLGYTYKTSIKAGLSLGQISEFSFILFGLGITYGHIADPALKSVIMMVGLITICGSAYMTMYNEKIFYLLQKYLGLDVDKHSTKHDLHNALTHHEIVLFGYGRMGGQLGSVLESHDMPYAIVDHDPAVIKELKDKKIDAVFADANNTDAYKELIDSDVKMIISTLKDFDDNLMIMDMVSKHNDDIMVVMIAHHVDEALALYEQGADYVIVPHHVSAHHATMMIQDIKFEKDVLEVKRNEHKEWLSSL